MIQHEFAQHAKEILQNDPNVIGLAAAGSWLTNELDIYSDLDLLLITKEKISGSKDKMVAYARQLGPLLTAFTGEHVGEPRLLICLYDAPLLHVDIKFLTPDEFSQRIETPIMLLDTEDQLKNILQKTRAVFPYPDYQWIEDRFWTWIHYALLKTGRGEYFEAVDFLGFLRMSVLGPLLHIKNGNLPKGVRKVEMQLDPQDFTVLKSTLPSYKRASILHALNNAVNLYRALRKELFDEKTTLHLLAEERVMKYFSLINENKTA